MDRMNRPIIGYDWFSELHMLLRHFPPNRGKNPLPPELHYATHAYQFMHHAKHGRIRLMPFSGFELTQPNEDTIHVDGLTSELHAIFFGRQLRVATGAAKYGGSSSRGCKIDQQLKALVNDNVVPNDPLVKEYVDRFLNFLYVNRLKPFWTQVPVYNAKMLLATTIDLFVIDLTIDHTQHSNILNLQLKSGFDENYNRSDGCLKSPVCNSEIIRAIPDTHSNRHMIQNMVEHLIVQKEYGAPLHNSEIVVLSENLISRHPLLHDIELEQHIVREIKLRKTTTKCEMHIQQVRADYARKAVINKIISKKKDTINKCAKVLQKKH